MLPYSLIPLIAVVWLTIRHVRSAHATDRSKRLVVFLTAISVLVAWVLPVPLFLVVLIQIAICAYIILHQMITTLDDPRARP